MAIPCVLSIAGSDSGGGAGIQADLKAFAACGVHGTTAITALTAQNTVAVTAVHQVPGEIIVAQVQAVVEDIGVDAVKVGMLGTEETVEAVEAAFRLLGPDVPIVIDPVMVAESGAELLEHGARRALIDRLFERATVITPNLPEACAIATVAGGDGSREVAELARDMLALGPSAVVVTGGHREEAVDVFCDSDRCVEIAGPRHRDGAAHGSGCTHSSALAARLAWGDDPLTAARTAKQIAARAIAHGLHDVGRGAGPVNVLGARSERPERF